MYGIVPIKDMRFLGSWVTRLLIQKSGLNCILDIEKWHPEFVGKISENAIIDGEIIRVQLY